MSKKNSLALRILRNFSVRWYDYNDNLCCTTWIFTRALPGDTYQCGMYHFLFGRARTRGSPRSLRFRNLSCRLLVVSLSDGLSAAGVGALERPKTIGDITEVHSLNTAYIGIYEVVETKALIIKST